jgi:hypothetical protein
MVSIDGMSYLLEIKSEHDRDMILPVRLTNLEIERSSNDQRHQNTTGMLKLGFYGEPMTLAPFIGQVVPTLVPAERGNIYIKLEPDSQSYNLFRRCLLVSYNADLVVDDLFFIQTKWFYSDSEVVLRPPVEIIERNEISVRINSVAIPPTRQEVIDSFYNNYWRNRRGRAPSYSPALNWRQFGF